MKLSIVVPVYNDINTVLEVIKRVQAHRSEKEIIIVDDGSTDGTEELLKGIKDHNVKLISLDRNRGKGYALREGFKQVTGDIVIIQDADLEYHPDEYGILVEKILEDKADVVYGTRFLGVHRAFHFSHLLGNQLINLIANIFFDTNLTDMMTGFKVFKAEVVRRMMLSADGFGIEAEMTAEVFRNRWRVYEVPISYSGRSYDEGKKIRPWDFFRVVFWLLKARLRSSDVGTDTLLRMKLMKNNTQWIYEKIRPYLGQRILEIGSGIGTFSRYLAKKGRIIFLSEVNEDYLRYLKNTFISNPFVQIIKSDISMKIRVAERIDTVVCINVLEHVYDDVGALRNIADILVSGGRLLLLVPAHMILFSDFDKSIGHFRRYSRQEVERKLESCGFEVEKNEYMDFLASIGWFVRYKIFRAQRMPSTQIKIFDLIIPLVAFLERYIKFPFGLSLFVLAKKK